MWLEADTAAELPVQHLAFAKQYHAKMEGCLHVLNQSACIGTATDSQHVSSCVLPTVWKALSTQLLKCATFDEVINTADVYLLVKHSRAEDARQHKLPKKLGQRQAVR